MSCIRYSTFKPSATLVWLALVLRWSESTATSICTSPSTPSQASPAASALPSILVVGSINVDITMEVHRLPSRGETTTARHPATTTAVGGKGANQAVAAARLTLGTRRAARFVCRFGDDAHAAMLEAALKSDGVDVSGCGRAAGMPSGQGMVMLEADGTASSVVLGGANTAWPEVSGASLAHLMEGTGVVLLQREVPEHVNQAVAAAAAAAGVPVIQDAGGEDRPLPPALLPLLDYVAPNESELQRLTGMPTDSEEQVLAAAATLAQRGAKAVLVTLAERGALLLHANGTVLRQAAVAAPGGAVVDATAAGDAFRAGFAVALVEGRGLQECLLFGAAAGAAAVSRKGAVPSLPTRKEVEQLLGQQWQQQRAAAADSAAAQQSCAASPAAAHMSAPLADCPFKFASRLNSMHARRDLAEPAADGGDDALGWIKRQSRVRGLSLIDFNYPQHLQGHSVEAITAALAEAGLAAGAVCMRFPGEKFGLGAMSNPSEALRSAAVALAVEGCGWAVQLGARDLIVWSPYDGYDYHFQVDYQAAWRHTVASFQQLADSCPPGIRVSLEFKPTDGSSRFAIVPSTGSALLLARDVKRPNFGLTLDIGHLLMAGENPAQSIAAVAQEGKLFGMQLNDAHVRLGAEDGLAFGSVNAGMALEVVRWLQRVGYDGHIYFDTFPRNEDPVREAEWNVRRFRALWCKAARLGARGVDAYGREHDGMGVLEVLAAEEE